MESICNSVFFFFFFNILSPAKAGISRPVARYGLPPPHRGNFVDHDFLDVLRLFCNMLALWQWKRYRITAHYICYLSKDINLTLKEQKLGLM